MRILGIGVDIIQNKRIKSLIKNKNFITRTFSPKEIKFSQKYSNKTNYFSKRFAAKESLAKSLGSGFRDNLNFKDIEILNDKEGKPHLFFTGKTKIYIEKKEKILKAQLKFDISLSDDHPYVIAFVVISLAPYV